MKIMIFALLLWVSLVNVVRAVLVAFTGDPSSLTDDQVVGVASTIFENVDKGQWWPVVGPIVLVSVWLFKKYDQNIPKFGPAISKFMDNPLVSFALPFIVSAAGGVGTAMAAGQSPREALNTVMKVGMEAVVLYVGAKKAKEQFAAGNAAAAEVAAGGKAAAIDELKKP